VADQLNYPDPRGYNSLARTDWPYVLNAIDPSFKRNSAIGHALSLLTLAYLAWEILRARKGSLRSDTGTLALAGPASAISMLAVYHHHYDIGILLVPLIGYLSHPEFRSLRATWWFVAPVALYAGLYPYAKVAAFADQIMGPISVLFTKPLACVVCIIALIASCFVLHRTLQREGSASPVDGWRRRREDLLEEGHVD